MPGGEEDGLVGAVSCILAPRGRFDAVPGHEGDAVDPCGGVSLAQKSEKGGAECRIGVPAIEYHESGSSWSLNAIMLRPRM